MQIVLPCSLRCCALITVSRLEVILGILFILHPRKTTRALTTCAHSRTAVWYVQTTFRAYRMKLGIMKCFVCWPVIDKYCVCKTQLQLNQQESILSVRVCDSLFLAVVVREQNATSNLSLKNHQALFDKTVASWLSLSCQTTMLILSHLEKRLR